MSHNTTQISDLPENIKMQNHELPTAQDAGFRDANIHYPPKPLFLTTTNLKIWSNHHNINYHPEIFR